ncbi:DUF1541 domain-containing protein [Bacillus salacetis]|uniref:DUF1541 domain-containing protein n=1 Tax=Bacillus salacetis TaxID=2315464 RepID=A0A3A1R5P1_9BACI|nr:YdhK family protein [Bacillus salacetis]RIW38360.1 DUF1541 domain-containing protein [Bacillus salacetis]
MKKIILLSVALLIIALAACGIGTKENATGSNEEEHQSDTEENPSGHTGMDHSMEGDIPEGMQEAEDPKYKTGSKVIIEKDHMSGMKGAEATIVGAYETTVYRVSYDPVTGGDRVEEHEWVVHEELKEADQEPFKPGSGVTIEAAHMEGMKGADATVDTAEEKTVYVIDYTPTDGSKPVKNHLWMSEEELHSSEQTY